MNTKYLILYHSCKGKRTKKLTSLGPGFRRKSVYTFVIEFTASCEGNRIATTPKEKEVLRVFQLKAYQTNQAFNRFVTLADIVTQKQIVFLIRRPTLGKYLREILIVAQCASRHNHWNTKSQ